MRLAPRSRWLMVAVAGLALAVGGVRLALPPCGDWATAAPRVLGMGAAEGEPRAGAAAVPIDTSLPTTVAGYGPPRKTARTIAAPLEARATVLEIGTQRLGVVQLDVLLVTEAMRRAVGEGFAGQVWLVASHTHTSLGGYDHRWTSQVAALGAADAEQEGRLVKAARESLALASERLQPVTLDVRDVDLSLAVPRSGAAVEPGLSVVRFVQGTTPIAQWVVYSAHPTLADPSAEALDPDWPGRLAHLLATGRGPVTLVLQGAGGNATVDRGKAANADAMAQLVAAALRDQGRPTVLEPQLRWVELGFALPRPDGSRLAPPVLAPLVNRALCRGAEPQASLTMLRLGSLSLLWVPFEPTAGAGAVLRAQARAGRVLGLANGYDGYLETAEAVRDGQGEARRQYFGPELLERVVEAASLAAQRTEAR